MRRWHMNVDSLDDNSKVSVAVLEEAKNNTRSILEAVGFIIDILSIYHMLLAGMALGYIIILFNVTSIAQLLSFFVYITIYADYFFYVSSFILFVFLIIFAGVLYITKSHPFENILVIISAVLLLINLFVTTFSLPMSLMVNSQTKDYPDWGTSTMAIDTFGVQLDKVFRPLATFRMVLIIVTSPLYAISASNAREKSWQILLSMVGRENTFRK